MTTTAIATDALPARVKALYERANIERDAALDELPALYTDDIQFMNPVEGGRGMIGFTGAWKKAFRMYRVFEFTNIVVAGSDEVFSLTYTMKIGFGIGPVFHADMMTDCRGRDGKVFYVRDYFDPVGTLVGPIAPLRWLYRFVFKHLIA